MAHDTVVVEISHLRNANGGVFQPEIGSFRLHLAAKTIRKYVEAVQWSAAVHLLADTCWTRWEQVTGPDIERWMVRLLGRYSQAYASN